MLYWKNILLQLRQRPVRSMILALFLTVTAVVLLLGGYVQQTVQSYFDLIAQETGTGILVWRQGRDSEEPYAPALLEDLLACDHVDGYNQSYSCSCTPISFVNSGYQNDTPYSAEPENEQILLIGNHDIQFYQSFRTGTMLLSQGTFPTQEEPGLLIDTYLAQQNGISVGDSLTFWNERENARVTAVVRGFYQTAEPPKVDCGDYYAVAAASYVFCDLEETWRQAADFYDTAAPITLYADSAQNVDKVIETITPLLAAYSDGETQYKCVSEYASQESSEGGNGGFLVFRDGCNLLLSGLQLVVCLLSALMTVLWMRDHQRDIGIYRVLGWSRGRILTTLLWEGSILVLSSDLIAGAAGLLYVRQLGEGMLTYFLQTMDGHAQSAARLNEAMLLTARGASLLPGMLWQGLFCLLVVLLCSLHALHQRCHTLAVRRVGDAGSSKRIRTAGILLRLRFTRSHSPPHTHKYTHLPAHSPSA